MCCCWNCIVFSHVLYSCYKTYQAFIREGAFNRIKIRYIVELSSETLWIVLFFDTSAKRDILCLFILWFFLKHRKFPICEVFWILLIQVWGINTQFITICGFTKILLRNFSVVFLSFLRRCCVFTIFFFWLFKTRNTIKQVSLFVTFIF